MERRDQLRYEEYKNKQASHSLIRELKARNEIKGMNVVYTNKRSEKLAEKALRSKIKSVVISMSHNGYLAFEHFWTVLYMLKITQNLGRNQEDNILTARMSRVKEYKETMELEFAIQLWNKINWYLFNYIDAAILIDFLTILLSNSYNKLTIGEQYIYEISQADDVPFEEVEKNKERNAELVLGSVWTVEQLFDFFKNKLNWASIVSRNGVSIDGDLKKQRLTQELFKECTFRPKILKKSKDLRRKTLSMAKLEDSVNVFDQRQSISSLQIHQTNDNHDDYSSPIYNIETNNGGTTRSKNLR